MWHFLAALWPYAAGIGGIGGLVAGLRRFLPSLVSFLSDAGTAPFLRNQNKTLRILLKERTEDYESLLSDYRELAKSRRKQGRSPEDS